MTIPTAMMKSILQKSLSRKLMTKKPLKILTSKKARKKLIVIMKLMCLPPRMI
ncbi:MAG: hypothetical protein LUC38_03400 [Oscillospiraceae bacterium]|nr:hypothetical protein [Ruminococcus sp.]MCD8344988.1 hypothetical protein [Oscillospiraceae bacterium]